MTVVRSLAFQNARKSTGQSTYYRRKGVQLVRSKPTFAPGRTFTQKQIDCQETMKLARLCITEFCMQSLIDICNVSNIKRYNASTQVNRMVANIINDNKATMFATHQTAEEHLNDFLAASASAYNKGDIELNSGWMRVNTTVVEGVPMMDCDVAIQTSFLNQILQSATRKARPREPFTISNIGFAGIIQTRPDLVGQTGTVLPCWMESYSELDFDHHTTLHFTSPILMRYPHDTDYSGLGYYMLFVYSQKGTTEQVSGGKSVYTVSSFYAECENMNEWVEIPT